MQIDLEEIICFDTKQNHSGVKAPLRPIITLLGI